MKLTLKACLGLICLLTLAACGSNATPAAPTTTVEPTQMSTATALPTETLQPTETPPVTANPETTGTPGADTTSTAQAPSIGGATLPAGTAAAQPPAANPPAGGKAPEKYTFLGQDVPDRTQFLPNRTVTITWTIKNTGTVGWTKEYTLRHFAGPKPAKDVYSFSKDVPVNDTINFTVTFTTPDAPGNYDLWFKLTNGAGQNFGDLDLVYTVSNSPIKATSTPAQ